MLFSKNSQPTDIDEIEFEDGAIILFNDPLSELNLYEITLIRHYGSEIRFDKSVTKD